MKKMQLIIVNQIDLAYSNDFTNGEASELAFF